MESLPLEIVIKIFMNCETNDLLRLSEVCTYFNRIVSNTKKISKKISVHFRNQNPQIQNFGTRRYTKLVIEGFSELLHGPILNQIGDDIESIEIRRWTWSLGTNLLLFVFKKCPNLKFIKFHKIQFHYHVEINESLVFRHSLDLQLLESDSRIFRIFQNSKVHRLVYDYVPTGGLFPIPDMIDFLKAQEQLEDLTLSGFVAFFNAGIGRIIFHDSSLSNVKFRLKRLTVKDSPVFQTIYLRRFLDLHVESLKYLEIEGTEFWDFGYINRCVGINELKIGKKVGAIPMKSFEPVPTVRMLTIEGPVDKRFLSNFPSLKILHASKLKTEKEKFDVELICNEIEELKIERTWLGGFFKLPKLRKLHLKNIRVLKYEIFDENPYIEEIIVENCENLMLDVDRIRSRLPNLRSFKRFTVLKIGNKV